MHLLIHLVVFLSYFRQTVDGLFETRGRIEVGIGFWLDNLNEGDSMEDIVLGGDNIKNVRKEISRNDVVWIYMVQGTNRWRAFLTQ
jgi:hypothetical protein